MMTAVPTTDTTFLNQRRQAIGQHPTQIGLDYVELEPWTPGSWYLWLHFIPAAPTVPDKPVTPATLTTDNIRITDVAGQLDLSMEVVEIIFTPADDGEQAIPDAIGIVVREAERPVQSSSHAQRYIVHLINVPHLDPFFAQMAFSLHVDEPGLVDSHVSLKTEPEPAPTPNINYLARDYSTFRKLLLDRLSVVMPAWSERNPADIGITLVEVLAYAADYLSYYQDAVATEAYLGTARRRVSVRRHARLLDYMMHEGCNARVWVQVQVAEPLFLAEKTPLITRIPGQDTRLSPRANQTLGSVIMQYNDVEGEAPQVFETMHAITLRPAHNEMPLYTWGATELTLPKGSTRATLRQRGDIALSPGDVLILEEVKNPATGEGAGANLAHRHAVRLTSVTETADAIGGALLGEESAEIPLLDVCWQAEDALPFDLCLATVVNGNPIDSVSVARGNIVLADHGRTVRDEPLEPAIVPEQGRYAPRLQRANTTHGTPYDDELARTQSAATVMIQSPDKAVPLIALAAADEVWKPQKDLLNSTRFSLDFVVETDNDGQAFLRFGDGEHGKRPVAGTALTATYRIGNGTVGNVGADAIAHVVSEQPGIRAVRNPIPAQGGTDPESIERVRRDAPQALRDQERAVTEADYAAIAASVTQIHTATIANNPVTTITLSDAETAVQSRFAPNQWVEFSNEALTLHGLPGIFARLTAVSEHSLTVGAWEPMTPEQQALCGDDWPRNLGTRPIVRRWDSPGIVTLETPVTSDGWLELEKGIEILFEAGHYKTGDYWLIPTRHLTGQIDWPATDPQPPLGIRHHYAPLAALTLAKGTWTIQEDLRRLFSALTGGLLSKQGDVMTGALRIGADLYIDDKVGIGTTQPEAALDVKGHALINGSLTVDNNTLHVQSGQNRVGIGTPAPARTLDVDGDIITRAISVGKSREDHWDTDGVFYRYNGQAYITVDDNLYIRDAKGAIKMHFDTNRGRLCIGDTGPAEALDVWGKIRLNSGQERECRMWVDDNRKALMFQMTGSHHHPNKTRIALWNGDDNWDFSSDGRLKTAIEDEEHILARLMQLAVKNYYWKDEPDAPRKKIGFIAQDVRPLFPALVGEVPDDAGDEPMLTLKYGAFGVLAVGGLQELKREKDADIAALRTLIEQEISNLNAQIQRNS